MTGKQSNNQALFQIRVLQSLVSGGMSQFVQGLHLDLADTLPDHAEAAVHSFLLATKQMQIAQSTISLRKRFMGASLPAKLLRST
jgi:hypothetical protein